MKVYLIGAGPGDPGLITVRGLEALKNSDVVLYDRLANSELLSYCKPEAEMIFVGKESGLHSLPQEVIQEIIIDKARQGKTVARLKGGDPLIFGRGSEEALSLMEAGIDFEIIPGVTAAVGASAYAGIPLTHRNLVTQCVLVTAHESKKENSQLEWEKLASLKNTNLVIYMGASTIPKTVDALIEGGMAPDMPSAVIENGTLPRQRNIYTTLEKLPEIVKKEDLRPPLLFIIGPTAALGCSIKPKNHL